MFRDTHTPIAPLTMKSTWENDFSSSERISEDELVKALKRRDKKALEYLYDHYSETLYGVIFQVLQNDKLAEDVLQESFVKIWKNIEHYQKEKGRLFTWLLRIARNSAIDKLRSKHQKVNRLSLDSALSVKFQPETETIPIDRIGLRDLFVNMKPEHKQLIEFYKKKPSDNYIRKNIFLFVVKNIKSQYNNNLPFTIKIDT